MDLCLQKGDLAAKVMSTPVNKKGMGLFSWLADKWLAAHIPADELDSPQNQWFCYLMCWSMHGPDLHRGHAGEYCELGSRLHPSVV